MATTSAKGTAFYSASRAYLAGRPTARTALKYVGAAVIGAAVTVTLTKIAPEQKITPGSGILFAVMTTLFSGVSLAVKMARSALRWSGVVKEFKAGPNDGVAADVVRLEGDGNAVLNSLFRGNERKVVAVRHRVSEMRAAAEPIAPIAQPQRPASAGPDATEYIAGRYGRATPFIKEVGDRPAPVRRDPDATEVVTPDDPRHPDRKKQ